MLQHHALRITVAVFSTLTMWAPASANPGKAMPPVSVGIPVSPPPTVYVPNVTSNVNSAVNAARPGGGGGGGGGGGTLGAATNATIGSFTNAAPNPTKVSTGTTKSPAPTNVNLNTNGIQNALRDTDPDAVKTRPQLTAEIATLNAEWEAMDAAQKAALDLKTRNDTDTLTPEEKTARDAAGLTKEALSVKLFNENSERASNMGKKTAVIEEKIQKRNQKDF